MSHSTFHALSGPRPGSLSLSAFRKTLWISPALFLAHAGEDSPRLAEWMRRTQLFEPVSRAQTIVALLLLAALSFLCAYAAHKGTRWGIYILVWMQGFTFLHGVSHLIPSILLLGYTPGLVTGLLLMPVSYYVYRRARDYRYFGGKLAAALLMAAILLYDPVLRLSYKAGTALIHDQYRPEQVFHDQQALRPLTKRYRSL
jgi:hypothetical protein